jgi:hypothetical protein
MERPGTSSEGSLFELVARGQKDKYFMSNEKTASTPFSYSMDTWSASLDEVRDIQPNNMVDFGRSVEWEMNLYGDILIAASFSITLPSWLPLNISPLCSKTIIQDASGIQYGYTRGIGAFLFEQIQFYQDTVLLQEFSGDFLYAWNHLQGSLPNQGLALKELGEHGGSSFEIQKNAVPGKLILRLPLIGCAHVNEGGFPLVSNPGQKFRLRCKLRRLEDLVESSDSAVKPAPWNRKGFVSIQKGGIQTPFTALSRELIEKPLITLQTIQRYIRNPTQTHICNKKFEIPFLRPFENVISLDPNDYAPVSGGTPSLITKRIDGRHPSEGILLFFQSDYCLERNQLWNFKNPLNAGDYFNSLKLLIAGKERETVWSSLIWNQLSPFTKSEIVPKIPISWISFTYGPTYGYRAPEKRTPSGTVNFSTADRPTLWIDLINTLPSSLTKKKRVHMRCIVVGWGNYTIEDGRGYIQFMN